MPAAGRELHRGSRPRHHSPGRAHLPAGQLAWGYLDRRGADAIREAHPTGHPRPLPGHQPRAYPRNARAPTATARASHHQPNRGPTAGRACGMIKEPTMETMNQGAQTSEGIAFVMTQAMKQQLRDLGFTPEQIREMPPAIGHHIINDFPKLRDRCKGLSKERMAQFTKAYLEDVLEDPPTDAISAFEEEDAQPEASPDPQAQTIHTTDKPLPRDAEMQAAIDAGMQVMSDPGNEPKRTRDAPRRMHPREGRPAIDINDPNVKRVLERYRPLSLQEIAQQKPPQWLLARHIPENSLVELFGEFATCKSFLALAWALSIAAGKPWLGQKTQQGHVVYVYAEGTQGLRKRGLAWCKENGLDDFPEKFHAIPRPIDMRDPNALDHVALAIKLALPKTKPSLIVIDTLNRCFGGGDENSTQDMTGFINGCDALREEFGATVLVVHHSGKDRVKGSRGASALGGAMDVIFELVKARRDQPLAILRNNTNTTKPHKDSAPLPP